MTLNELIDNLIKYKDVYGESDVTLLGVGGSSKGNDLGKIKSVKRVKDKIFIEAVIKSVVIGRDSRDQGLQNLYKLGSGYTSDINFEEDNHTVSITESKEFINNGKSNISSTLSNLNKLSNYNTTEKTDVEEADEASLDGNWW